MCIRQTDLISHAPLPRFITIALWYALALIATQWYFLQVHHAPPRSLTIPSQAILIISKAPPPAATSVTHGILETLVLQPRKIQRIPTQPPALTMFT